MAGLGIFAGNDPAEAYAPANQTGSILGMLDAGVTGPQANMLSSLNQSNGMLQQFFQQAMAMKMQETLANKSFESKWKAIMSSPSFTPEQKKQAMQEAAMRGLAVNKSDGTPIYDSGMGAKIGHGAMQFLDSALFGLVPDQVSGMFDTGYGDMGTAENIGNIAGMLTALIPIGAAFKGAGLATQALGKTATGGARMAAGAKGAAQGLLRGYPNFLLRGGQFSDDVLKGFVAEGKAATQAGMTKGALESTKIIEEVGGKELLAQIEGKVTSLKNSKQFDILKTYKKSKDGMESVVANKEKLLPEYTKKFDAIKNVSSKIKTNTKGELIWNDGSLLTAEEIASHKTNLKLIETVEGNGGIEGIFNKVEKGAKHIIEDKHIGTIAKDNFKNFNLDAPEFWNYHNNKKVLDFMDEWAHVDGAGNLITKEISQINRVASRNIVDDTGKALFSKDQKLNGAQALEYINEKTFKGSLKGIGDSPIKGTNWSKKLGIEAKTSNTSNEIIRTEVGTGEESASISTNIPKTPAEFIKGVKDEYNAMTSAQQEKLISVLNSDQKIIFKRIMSGEGEIIQGNIVQDLLKEYMSLMMKGQ